MKRLILILFILTSVGLTAQCFDDQHNTTWYDAWVACSPAMNPNPARGNSYWIHYDLGDAYRLGQMHMWNINDPSHVNYGIRNYVVDYSMDGETWTELGTHMLLMASGQPDYEGVDALDFGEAKARYVIITAIDNWGGACYGFSEMRIDVITSDGQSQPTGDFCLEAQIYPNPTNGDASLIVRNECESSFFYIVRNTMGQIVATEQLGSAIGKNKYLIDSTDYPPGVYAVTLYQNNQSLTIQLVVL